MSNIKKLVLMLSAASVIATNAIAGNKQSRNNIPYAKADVGYSTMPEKLNSRFYSSRAGGAFVGAFGIGYAINSKIRTDVSFAYRGEYRYAATGQSGLRAKQRISSTALVLGGYWSPFGSVLKYVSPYLMGGAGLAINKTGAFGNSQTYVLGQKTGQFAWQIGTGLLYKASDRIHVDLMYKYVDLGDVRTGDVMYDGSTRRASSGISGKLKAHEITIGVWFNFI
jgi:opacity protein-like surface antigen